MRVVVTTKAGDREGLLMEGLADFVHDAIEHGMSPAAGVRVRVGFRGQVLQITATEEVPDDILAVAAARRAAQPTVREAEDFVRGHLGEPLPMPPIEAGPWRTVDDEIHEECGHAPIVEQEVMLLAPDGPVSIGLHRHCAHCSGMLDGSDDGSDEEGGDDE